MKNFWQLFATGIAIGIMFGMLMGAIFTTVETPSFEPRNPVSYEQYMDARLSIHWLIIECLSAKQMDPDRECAGDTQQEWETIRVYEQWEIENAS